MLYFASRVSISIGCEILNAKQAFRTIADASGLSRRALSAALGKTDNYISALLSQGRAPGSDLMAAIAQACGYTLALIPHGSTLPRGSIVLDGTED